jgi:hypothetical protein
MYTLGLPFASWMIQRVSIFHIFSHSDISRRVSLGLSLHLPPDVVCILRSQTAARNALIGSYLSCTLNCVYVCVCVCVCVCVGGSGGTRVWTQDFALARQDSTFLARPPALSWILKYGVVIEWVEGLTEKFFFFFFFFFWVPNKALHIL